MPDIEEDIANEVEWIYQRLCEEQKRESLLQQDQQVKNKIRKVLRNFRAEFMDIPYVVKYRKFEYKKELMEDDIWAIFNLDLEYGRFQEQLKLMKE